MALFLRPAIWHADSSSGAAQDRAHRVAVTAQARDSAMCPSRSDQSWPAKWNVQNTQPQAQPRTYGR